MCLLHVVPAVDGVTAEKVQKVFHAMKVKKPSHKVKSGWRRGLLERIECLSQVVKPRLLFQENHCIFVSPGETVATILLLLFLLFLFKRIFEII